VKARTRAARIARASARRLLADWARAARAADAAECPLNVAVHLTWSALLHGDMREGHVLGLAPVERDKRFWDALRLCAARAGVPWVALRGPEYDGRRGLHLHLVLHLPDSAAVHDAIGVIERLTGAPAERVIMEGRTWRRHHGVVARSACGGWLLQRHVAARGGSGEKLAAYAGKGSGKALVEGQHRLSNELATLARQATARTSSHGAGHVLSKKTPAPEGAGGRREGANARTAA